MAVRKVEVERFSLTTSAETPSESPAAWPRGQPVGFACLAWSLLALVEAAGRSGVADA